jgi:hypothetical protein
MHHRMRTAATAITVSILIWLSWEVVHAGREAGWHALGWTAGAWAAFAAAVWLVRRVPMRSAAALILVGCVGAGIAAASAHQTGSDDLYRYVWDGKVQAAGIDPYQYVPSAPQLAGLRDPSLWPAHRTAWCLAPGTPDPDQPGALVPGCSLINRPAVHTIYPPVAEAYFLAVHAVSPAAARYKPIQLAGAALALLTTATLLLGLGRLGRDPRAAALWGWCPLVAYESGNGAHVDVLGALLTVCALVVLSRARGTRRAALGGALLGLAIGAKLTPVFAVPSALRRRPLAVCGTAAAVVALSYLPHVLAVGPKVIGYLPGYINEQGYSSGGGYQLLSILLPDRWTSAAAAGAVAATALAVYRFADPDRPWRGALVLTGVVLMVTTPQYGWYALLLCAFIAIDGRIEWFALALAVPIGWAAHGLGWSSLNGQRLGYGLALLAVVVPAILRARADRRRSPGAPTAPPPHIQESDMPVVDVVLPCLDEAGALPYVLGRMPEGYRAIVVDNGSSDGSAALAARLGARVVSEPRRGFGAACHAGLAAATAPVVCICDCDGSLDPAQLPRVADPVIGGTADLVLGRRRPVTAGAWPPHARAANQVLAFRLRRAGVPVRDLGPMRAARREALLGLGVGDRRSGYPLETVLAAARSGWRISETDVDYAPRTGKSKVTGTVGGTLRAIRDMNRVWKEAARWAR